MPRSYFPEIIIDLVWGDGEGRGAWLAKAPQAGLMCSPGLRTTELGKGERMVIQNEAQVHRPALQNGLVPTTTTERRKALKQAVPLSGQMAKGRDTREPKAKKLSHRRRKHGPRGLSLLQSLLPAHLMVLLLLMGNKHGHSSCWYGISEFITAIHPTSSYKM